MSAVIESVSGMFHGLLTEFLLLTDRILMQQFV